MFDEADGSKVLSEVLDSLLQASENASNSLTSINSVASLLVSALRSAAGQAELPFLDRYEYRQFPLPNLQKIDPNPNDHQVKTPLDRSDDTIDYDEIIDECAQMLLNKTYPQAPNVPESIEDLVRIKIRRLCPELFYMDGRSLPKNEGPNGNISVRHVQPMAPGKHFVCKNSFSKHYETLLRRSPATFRLYRLIRKIMFDQTARMFQTGLKGTLVYDVMDYKIAQSIGPDEKYFELTRFLIFNSRFESGNLQFATKISQYEYDLQVQSDINAGPGKHNQWFYFSVRNMIPNVQYRFNILNLSKPASQFNNGMQPVIYSAEDSTWKRIGDHVFYIKYKQLIRNHYLKQPISEQDEQKTKNNGPANTYSTLVLSVNFKHANDLCFIAYHYPYTYSELQRSLYQLNAMPKFKENCRRTLLCRTLGGNDCILLTITDFSKNGTWV